MEAIKTLTVLLNYTGFPVKAQKCLSKYSLSLFVPTEGTRAERKRKARIHWHDFPFTSSSFSSQIIKDKQTEPVIMTPNWCQGCIIKAIISKQTFLFKWTAVFVRSMLQSLAKLDKQTTFQLGKKTFWFKLIFLRAKSKFRQQIKSFPEARS